MADQITFRRVRTFMIFLIWSTKGLYIEIAGPTMIDLKLIFNTDYASVTRSVAGRGAGGFVGAVLGAFLVDKYEGHLDLFIAVCSTGCAVCLSAIPHMADIDHVWLLFFVIGGLSSIVNMAGTRAALMMWKERSSSILPLLHMGFGVGALIAPIVCTPFLAKLSLVTDSTDTGRRYDVIKESRVEHAYFAIGVFTFAVSTPFYMFQCRMTPRLNRISDEAITHLKTKKPRTFKEMLNPGTYADGNCQFGFYMLVILFIYYFNLVGGEKSVASFVRTISVDLYGFARDDASLVHTGFWLSLTIGRLTSACVAHYVTIRTLFTFQVILNMCSMLLLYQYGVAGAYCFTVLVLTQGFFFAPLYPQGVAYGNTQMDITGVSLMVIVFAGSFGDMVYLWAAGRMYDVHGAQALFNLSLVASAILVICVVMFRNISGRRKHTFPSAIPNLETSKSIYGRLLGVFYK